MEQNESRARANRAMWNAYSAEYQAKHDPLIGREPKLWGMFAVPESELRALGPVDGLDVLELWCGAAQWAVSLADEGARVVGLDLSDEQLRAARARRSTLPLVHANAEELPFASETFDLVFCDHGAMSWGNPKRTVPEAARVLRPDGRLVFNSSSPLLMVCYDDERDMPTDRLVGDYFGQWLTEEGEGSATYSLTYGDWIRLLRRNGFIIEDLIEIRPPAGAKTTYLRTEPADWATRWPAEALWCARKT